MPIVSIFTDFFNSKLSTSISNGGLILPPSGDYTGSTKGGVSQHHNYLLLLYSGCRSNNINVLFPFRYDINSETQGIQNMFIHYTINFHSTKFRHTLLPHHNHQLLDKRILQNFSPLMQHHLGMRNIHRPEYIPNQEYHPL